MGGPEHVRRWVLLVMAGAVVPVLFLACKKDPVSFTDGYDAPLTEQSGTTHEGEYYPLARGNKWEMSGSMTIDMSGTMTMEQGSMSSTQDMDTTMTMEVDYTITVGADTQITLPGGTVTVFPVRTSGTTGGIDGAEDQETVQYLEKKDDGIYIKAVAVDQTGFPGGIMDAGDQILIKTPLVAGDTWESAPGFELSDLLGVQATGTEGSMSARAVTYVIGTESRSYKGESVDAIRLDQRIQVSGTVTESGMTMDISLQGTGTQYLVKDVGSIEETVDINMTMKMSGSEDGMTMSADITARMNGTTLLDSFTPGGSGLGKSLSFSGAPGGAGTMPHCRRMVGTLLRACRSRLE